MSSIKTTRQYGTFLTVYNVLVCFPVLRFEYKK